MLIDTDKLEDQLETAASVVAALVAYKAASTEAEWEAMETEQPLLMALLDACSDLEYMLTP